MKKWTRTRSILAATFLAALLFTTPEPSRAGVFVSITIAPPALPVYVQPPCPAEGYLWTPGYWAYGPAGYFWVPGIWVRPPRLGVLWTPGYWGFAGGIYGWHAGFWGPHVGFYGGVNYGFGYSGFGFGGGMWSGGVFRYNTAVTNVNTTVVRNVYVNRTVINNTTVVNNRASFNGPGGITARPTFQEQTAMREQHFQPTPSQVSQQRIASQDRTQLASINHGRPTVAAMDSVNGRRSNQQGRIANGVSSGSLTAGETRNLETRQQNINQQIAADRRANGGKLTPAEKQNISREQNGANRQIYQEKHNEKTAPR